jgi:hypothetical protein
LYSHPKTKVVCDGLLKYIEITTKGVVAINENKSNILLVPRSRMWKPWEESLKTKMTLLIVIVKHYM